MLIAILVILFVIVLVALISVRRRRLGSR